MLLSSCSGQQPGVETLSIPTAKLYCPNCGTDNLETNQICRNCQAGLPKRYLWGVGPDIATLPVGAAIGNKDRFFSKAPGLFLDTQPGGFSTDNPGISAAAMPYLKLFAHRLHIPQIYAIVAHNDVDIILLEQTPFTLQDFGLEQSPADDPTTAEIAGMATPFTIAWQRAGLVRQLNWLWQMAQLWQPFALEGVASSLLQPELLRVEGPLLRLRQLTPDSPYPHASQPNPSQAAPTQQPAQLAALGKLWQSWLPATQLALRPGLETLCTQLMDGRISAAELIVIQLEQWFELATKGVDGSALPLRFDLATGTDQGRLLSWQWHSSAKRY
jgi:protein phosphatase